VKDDFDKDVRWLGAALRTRALRRIWLQWDGHGYQKSLARARLALMFATPVKLLGLEIDPRGGIAELML
jgi:hypothetical protein